MKLLLYCTKAKPYLTRNDLPNEKGEFYKHWQLGGELDKKHLYGDTPILNGKIVAECDFEVEAITDDRLARAISDEMHLIERDNLLKDSWLTGEEIKKYFNFYNWQFEKQDKVVGYAIHIKNLHVFDEPKELNEVYKIDNVGDKLFTHSLKNAPQNMMYVSVNRWVYDFYEPNDINILISIKPEWLCKILNGKKTIEVRKKVLKEMK